MKNGAQRLKTLLSYKDLDLIDKIAYRVYKYKIVEFKIIELTRVYARFYRDGGVAGYKKDSCYLTLQEAKISQLRMNLNFLNEMNTNIIEYHKTLGDLIEEFPEYLI